VVTDHHECFKCGEQNRASAHFCRQCGEPLANQSASGNSAQLTATITSVAAPATPATPASPVGPVETARPAAPPPQPTPPPLPPPPDDRRRHGWWPVPLILAVVLGAAALAGWRTHWPTAVFGGRPVAQSQTAPAGSTGGAPAPSSPPPSSGGSGTSPSAATGGSDQQQAAEQLAGLLSQSVSDRSSVNDAYNDVMQCGPDLSQDAQTFQNAAQARQQLLTQLAGLPSRSALSPSMLQDLTSAWQQSIQVDNDYAQWAQAEAGNGCADASTNAHYVAADGPNQQATTAKTAFTGEWNPLAGEYGLTQYQQAQL
jgi:hypothetical protein